MSQNQTTIIREMRFGRIELEKRSNENEPESRKIIGYAAKYEKWSDPIWDTFIEKIIEGAFDDCDFSECIATFNHSVNNIMARVSSGTLKIEVDQIGLKFSFEAPNTTIGNDMLEMVRRGDISQCSFIFVIEEEKWREGEPGKLPQRELIKIAKVFDVSLVTYPAYPDTEVENTRQAIEQRCKEATKPQGNDSDRMELEIAHYRYNINNK